MVHDECPSYDTSRKSRFTYMLHYVNCKVSDMWQLLRTLEIKGKLAQHLTVTAHFQYNLQLHYWKYQMYDIFRKVIWFYLL